jgi:hypothetical protein
MTVMHQHESPGEVERAARRLAREYAGAASCYDDLAAPGWAAFVASRRRGLPDGGERAARRPGGAFPPRTG